jgi:hypothetical protein
MLLHERKMMFIGTTYWSQRNGALLWAAFDRGATREQLQQLAAIGIDTVRLPLRWEDFQPRPERIASSALRSLEQVLELAGDARLQVVPSLLPLAVAGAIHVPAWVTAASFAADLTLSTKFGPLLLVRNETRPPLVWERTQHESEVRDLWTNPAMRAAQHKLIAEVVGYFGDHPALSGWELGSGMELAYVPSSSDAAAEWLGQTAELARRHGARGTLWCNATLRTLVRRDGPRPNAIVQAGCVPIVSVVPSEPAWNGLLLTSDMLGFVAALVRSLGGGVPGLIVGAPAVANGSGRVFADRAYGRAVEQPLLDHDEYAQLIETTLPQLRAVGVPGVCFLHAFCYREPFAPAPAHSQREQMMGMFDTNGAQLSVAAAVQRWAQQPPPAASIELPELDVENYWSDPAASFRRLWQEWQSNAERPT